MTHTMTMDANVEPGLTDTENPVDGSYTSLNSVIVLEEAKFSLPMGGIVISAGVGAFVGELVMFKSKSNDAVVDETDAAIVEEVASAADTAMVFAAAVAVTSVELVVVKSKSNEAVVVETDATVVEELASAADTVVASVAAVVVTSVEVVGIIIAGQQVSSKPFA
mmetsp:Transcript_20798/g.32560  ORF Transcript_20798/g.32560 Transcript_20798/m.32560 type:complete len:165 (-) Transcript_20798:1031-1525(-)